MKRRNDTIASLNSRRDFLKRSIALGLLAGTGTLFDSRPAFAAGNQNVSQRVLANIFLGGGPDLRHAFVPPFSTVTTNVGYAYWKNKATSHSIANDDTSLNTRWTNDFFPVSSGATQFGILRRCGWLKTMWDQGNVAFISNVFGSDSRDHDQATTVMELGDTTAPKSAFGSGWGGRLAYAARGNVLSVSGYPRAFSFGPDPAAPADLKRNSDQNVIIASNMRDYGLYDAARGIASVSTNQRVARALRSYYAGKRSTIADSSPFARFFDTEEKIRSFGDQIEARLASFPQPADLQSWIENSPYGWYLGMQLRNLHDALACSDIVNLRVTSMEFNGWDSHDNQRNEIEGKLEALFGDGQGLDLLYRNLSASAQQNLVFVLDGEFGRQIRSNGGNGTDHGEGNYIILVGNSVNGGVYGTMFPQREVDVLAQPNRYYNPDIQGLTAIDHAFGRTCDWVSPGSKSAVFPQFASKPIETGLNLAGLLA
jgi:uncharacterized protein (DUF1501 family)